MQTIGSLPHDDWKSDWTRAREIEPCRHVQTEKDYALFVLLGRINAHKYLHHCGDFSPDTERMKEVHRTIFMLIQPNTAGQFRQEEIKGTTAPGLIERDLEMLHESFVARLKEPLNDYRKAEAIGNYHAGFSTIEPFHRPGNGQVGRLIMEVQMDICFGYEKRPPIEPARYQEALTASRENRPEPMVNLVLHLHKEAQKLQKPDYGLEHLSKPQQIRF